MSTTEPLACRFPFQHNPDACTCSPDPIAVKLGRFEANAKSRAEQARQGRLTLLAVAVIVPILSFTSLYAVAAVVDQGRINLKNWMVANEPV